MAILITGASGFVGSAINEILTAQDYQTIKIGGKRERSATSKAKSREIDYRVEISDEQEVLSLEKLKNITAIVHSAGLAHQTDEKLYDKFFEVNVTGTINAVILAAQLKIERFILISSVSVYGKNIDGQIVNENAVCQPTGGYAESKLAAEQTAAEMCARYKINLTILRLTTVIGKGDKANFFRLIERIANGKFIKIGSGKNYKSLICKDDVGRACQTIIEQSRAHFEIFNISAEPLPIREILKTIEFALGVKINFLIIPSFIVKSVLKLNDLTVRFSSIQRLSKTVETWLSENAYSAEKIKDKYGFAPQITAREAIRLECEWYQSNFTPKIR